MIQQSNLYDPKRVTTFVADICSLEQVSKYVNTSSCDVALFIFVLSALSVEQMPLAIATSYACLKPGGVVLFRDYAWGDATQLRYEKTPSSRVLASGLCVRGDGTKAYFFTPQVLGNLFKDAGFECVQLLEREMEPSHPGGEPRRFLQAMFQRPC